jgi:hypothetical protein
MIFGALFMISDQFIITFFLINYGKGVSTNHNTSRCRIFPAARLDLTNITYPILSFV